MEVPEVIKYLVAWLGFGSAVWTLFERAETVIRPEIRTSISRWLQNADLGQAVKSWPDSFGKVFDAVFGERHLSLKCFIRSSLASITAVLLVSIVAWAVDPEIFRQLTTDVLIADHPILNIITSMLLLGALLNLIPDFISLLESRYIIKWMSQKKSVILWLLLLIFDLIIT